MTEINVSPEMLRAKARAIRAILERSQTEHRVLWDQIQGQVGLLPRDLRLSHTRANHPWQDNVATMYESYLQLAQAMEDAADGYALGDHNVGSFFPD